MMKKILSDKDLGSIRLFEQFLDPVTSHQVMLELKQTEWSDHKILIFGKWIQEPRRVAFFGNTDISYTYSGMEMALNPWTNRLESLKNSINLFTGKNFNSVLVNYYRTGDDYMGWHSDNEVELGENPHVCSLSLGQSRDFIFRLRTDHSKKIKICLQSGDLLLMENKIQKLWQHSLPKRKRANGERINLTFRNIIKG
jgi:alkylated DNA repair dioxygenase AlkB